MTMTSRMRTCAYGLASISMRDALFQVVRDNATDGLRLNDLM